MATHPEKIERIVLLRSLGYSIPSISADTGVSPRAVAAILSKAGVKKGSPIDNEAIAQERRRIIRQALDAEHVRQAIASSLADDLALARSVRDKASLILERIEPTDLRTAALASRALAALSTSIKAASDMTRLVLSPYDSEPECELPKLTISRMTPDEVAALRKRQAAETSSLDVADELPSEGG